MFKRNKSFLLHLAFIFINLILNFNNYDQRTNIK